MVDNDRQNSDMRDQFKCSECRTKKIKCKPRNRQWAATSQKCEYCQKHNKPCGPSYKKRDDPAVPGSRNGVTARKEESVRDAEDQQRAPILQPATILHSTAYAGGHNGDQPSLVTEESNGDRKRKFVSEKKAEELCDEATCLLGELNSFGRSHVFASHLIPVNCRDQDNPIRYNNEPDDKMKAMRDRFHSLFMEICRVGLQLHERGKNSDASGIFLKAIFVLENCGLGDDRKNGALWEIAKFYHDLGDEDLHEWLLMKATETHDTSIHQKDPCLPLANSLIKTSRRADQDLLKLWEEHFMVAGEASLAIPPIQRSAMHKNSGVASILLAHSNSIEQLPPALFNQEFLHVAATRGYEQNLTNLLHLGAQVDAPDLHNHTPLFRAAKEGHEGCCAELIRCGANVNSRDRHGTTILEVAAGAGHFDVVKQLVVAGAEVNPEILCCTSSPLQAAIENTKSPIEVALYLMGRNANVSIQRKDGKNAIDLAEERCAFLAEIMRQKQLQGPHPQNLFGTPQVFYFDQSHLDFGPGLP